MNKLQIALKKRTAVVLNSTEQSDDLSKVMTLQANVITLGFVLSEPLAKTLAALDSDTTYNQLVQELRSLLDKRGKVWNNVNHVEESWFSPSIT